MKMNIFLKTFFLTLFSILSLIGCKKDKSVSDLYKFPSTKDVLVLVNIDFTADANTNGGIDLAGKSFMLNAYALDANDKHVKIGLTSSTLVENLPVTLTGAHTSFEAVLSLPIEVQPRSSGYALRFELKQPSAALVLATPPSSLDALRGEIKAGTAASVNNVDLSLASSLAYKFLNSTVANVGTVPSLGSYADLVALFKAKQQTVEAGVDVSASHDIDSYVSAILAGVNYQVLTDSTFQKAVAEKLLSAASSEGTAAQKTVASEKLAEGFTTILISLTSQVTEALSDASSLTSKVFTGNFIDIASLPEPAAYSNAVFAPLAVRFTDSDSSASLGGDITITAPILATGVASYNIYFGGEDKASSKALLIGNVDASKSPLYLSLPAGTAQLSGVTRFWVYPVSNGAELNIPASVGINNAGGTNLAPQPPTSVTATNASITNTITWTSVTGAQSYNIYWSTTSPVRTTSNRIRNVTSPFLHKSLLNGTTYYYSVTTIVGGIESNLSSEAHAEIAVVSSSSVAAPLSVTATGGSSLNTISWASAPGATSYNIYWSLASPVTKASNKIADATSPYSHSGLNSATHYYYAVTAFIGSVESDLSSEVSGLTNPPLPPAPTSLVVMPGIEQASLSWSTITNASGYNVYWSTSSPVSKFDTKITNVSTNYTHGSLTGGSRYYYAVTSIVNGIESALSTELSAVPITSTAFTGTLDLNLQNCWTNFKYVAVSAAGDTLVAGYADCVFPNDVSSGNYESAFIAKFNRLGILQWVHGVSAATTQYTYTEGYGITVDKNGNSYLYGQTDGDVVNAGVSSGGGLDNSIAKYAPDGTRLWIRQFFAPTSQDGTRVAVDDNGGVYIAMPTDAQIPTGAPQIGTNSNSVLFKLSAVDGSTIWSRSVGNASAFADLPVLTISPDGQDIYMGGLATNDVSGTGVSGRSGLFLAKYNTLSGNRQWLVQSEKNTGFVSITPDNLSISPDGSKIAIAGTSGFDIATGIDLNHQSIYSVAYDSTGARIDLHQYSTPGVKVWDSLISNDGSVTFAGNSQNSFPVAKVGVQDVYVIRYNTGHTVTWSQQIGVPTYRAWGFGISFDASGNTLFATGSEGNLNTGSGAAGPQYQGYLLKFNPSGTRL